MNNLTLDKNFRSKVFQKLTHIMSASSLKNTTAEFDYLACMLDRTGHNYDLAMLLFKKLFQELPEQMLNTEQALIAENFQEATKIIHKLNGSMSFCGFKDLQELSNRLETALLQNHYAGIMPLFLQLKQEISIFQTLQDRILQHLAEVGT